MKIDYLSQSTIPSRAANSLHVMKMCHAFAANGHNVTSLHRAEQMSICRMKRFFGFTTWHLASGEKPFRGRASVGACTCTPPSLHWLRRRGPDLVYGRCAHTCFFFCTLGGGLFAVHGPAALLSCVAGGLAWGLAVPSLRGAGFSPFLVLFVCGAAVSVVILSLLLWVPSYTIGRDGRAVLNSYVRKYDRFGKGFRRWMKSMLYGTFLKHVVFERTNGLRVRYEDLAAEPERGLRRICAFLGRAYQPSMLDYREGQHVGIGGNRMRKRSDERIYLDEKWKRELSRRDRVKFALLGGWLNTCYGY